MAHDRNSPPKQEAGSYPAMPAIDFEAYLPYLEDEDIPEEKKRELRRLKRRETVIDRMAYGHGLSDSHGGHWTEEDEKQS